MRLWKTYLCAGLVYLFFAGAAFAADGDSAQARDNQGSTTATPPAIQPVQQEIWAQRHAEKVEAVKEHRYDLLMIGDSITHTIGAYGGKFEPLKEVWNKYYAPRNALNLGYSAARTEHILWNLQNGELEGQSPKLAVLLIGTNDQDDLNYPVAHSAARIYDGTKAIVNVIREKCPETTILILRIFPRGGYAEKALGKVGFYATPRMQEILKEAGSMTKQLADDKRVFWLNIGHIFLNSDGTINDSLMPDLLHPNAAGAEAWAKAIQPTLDKLMGGPPSGEQTENTAIVPLPKLEEDGYDWYGRHNAILRLKDAGNPDIVLIGDSITHYWGGEPKADPTRGPKAWDSGFGNCRVWNLGFGWDRTQNVIWRLDHGELDGIHPRVVILNIGTNNTSGTEKARKNTPDEIVEGIRQILLRIRAKTPESKIILMGVFPREEKPDAPRRAEIASINAKLAGLSAMPNVVFLDIGPKLLQPDGTISREIMADFCHPTEKGYQVWADALAPWIEQAMKAVSAVSPDGKIQLTAGVQEGKLMYACRYGSAEAVASSELGVELPEPLKNLEIVNVQRSRADEPWTPHWGERATIPNQYEALTVSVKEKGDTARAFDVEFRLYDEGFAFRYVFDREAFRLIKGENTEFRVPSDAVLFPIAKTEDCFPREPVAFADFDTAMPPLTGRFADGRVFSILEAYAVSYPRFKLTKNESGAVGVSFLRGGEITLAQSGGPFFTPWRLMMLAENEAKLIEQGYMVYNLNPPCTSDMSWVVPGKTISNEGNFEVRGIRTDDMISMVDFAAANNIKYLQIDWGWYGTEWAYSDAECEAWAQNNPELATDPSWRANTQPDPYKVARGVVPYFPTFKGRCRSTFVDLDIEKLLAYGKEKGVGLCLYLNGRMISKHDIDDLFAHYEGWGLAGLKPGFVAYGGASHTDQLRYLNETAAKHKLWLCTHDAYLPDGSSRTFANLMNVEGGGGNEHNLPAHHDVSLPFTRGLAGPFDITPLLFRAKKSNAHQLSLLMTIYAPAPVIRGGWNIRDNQEGNAFGTEIEFMKRVVTTWADTKVLDAKIGKHIVTVRKTADGEWFLGATNGNDPYTSKIELSFLDAGKAYELKLWTDAPEANGVWRGTVQTVQTVRSTDTVELPMAAAGGAIGIFSVKR